MARDKVYREAEKRIEEARRSGAKKLYMDDQVAELFVTISHRLGHLIHYEHDPALRDIVVLKPDWLATAEGLFYHLWVHPQFEAEY